MSKIDSETIFPNISIEKIAPILNIKRDLLHTFCTKNIQIGKTILVKIKKIPKISPSISDFTY